MSPPLPDRRSFLPNLPSPSTAMDSSAIQDAVSIDGHAGQAAVSVDGHEGSRRRMVNVVSPVPAPSRSRSSPSSSRLQSSASMVLHRGSYLVVTKGSQAREPAQAGPSFS
ncbi:hypothetical protein QYE76_043264 [Lolium multiflorum]|uniref:Uncharacterized protein n=1 Tax=Lolium multiflorum TaxID=4521 RepID=A0AAD8TH63_LOLMU|nr:hypothetical protein QYE76_043264 [Lolium multiflorum]